MEIILSWSSSLTFGNIQNQYEIKQIFGGVDNGEHTVFNQFFGSDKVNHDLKSEPEKTEQLYFYFFKLIPHVFVDQYMDKDWKSYVYSLAHNKKETDSRMQQGISIMIDYTPVPLFQISNQFNIKSVHIKLQIFT